MQKLTKYNVNFFQGKINENIPYFLSQRPGQPIHIRASFVAGSRFDTIPGIAHFLEHLLLAGSQKYPDKRQLTVNLENIGGSIGGSTNTDFLTIYLEIAEKKDLSFALGIFDEAINHSLFDDKAIETERGAILAELQMRYHNRSIWVMDIANRLIYQKTPCGTITSGTEDSVKLITRADLINFYETIFKINPVSWSISGDVDEKEIIETLGRLHSTKLSLDKMFDLELPIIREKTTDLEVFDDNKADLYFGFRTTPRNFSEAPSLDIIASYLAQDRGCKLQDELRYKRGLIYSCQGSNFISFDSGDWYIKTACLAENVQEVLNIIIKELEEIKENGLPEEDLRLIKNKLIKNNIVKMQTAQSWAIKSANPAFISAPETFLIDNYEREIEQVTPESIIEVANRYFTSNNWYLAMCGPKSLENININIRPGIKQK